MRQGFFLFGIIGFIILSLPVLAGIAGLVFGIITTAGKQKSVKVLGIGFIIQFISSILTAVLNVCVRTLPMKVYAAYSVGLNYFSIVCGIASLLCICIFLHKNYGTKLIYIPVFAIHIGGMLITNAVSNMLNRIKNIPKGSRGLWIAMTANINRFIVAAAIAVILIVIFYKHRKSEKVIPKAWIFRIIMLAASFMAVMISSLYYLSMFSHTKMLSSPISSNETFVSLMMAVFQSLAELFFPAYVAVRSLKKETSQPAA